jgi:hypothetical protein
MKYIKRIFKGITLIAGVIMLFLLSSCDKGFEKMNKNPNAYTEPLLTSLFSGVIIRNAGMGSNNTIYPNSKNAGCFVQYFASLHPTQWPGDKYVYKQNYNDGLWISAFPTPNKENQQIIDLTKGKPELVNQYNIARIMRVLILHRVTDLYGDMPYTDADLGFISGVYTPKYDKQADIYADMLKELDEAAKALDPAKPSFGAADFIYKGSPAKWKMFAYSLMLRLGMRLTKVNPAMAETWVKKAIAGGVMQSNADMAYLVHAATNSTTWNVDSEQLQGAEGPNPSVQGKGYCKLNKTFIDYLQATNDPRLPFYSTLWQGNINIANLPANSDPSKQKGLPSGYDYASIKSIYPTWVDDDLRNFSEPNINTILHLAAPTIFQSYTEVEYLLAEAALRGWGSGTPKEHYDKGVTASLLSQSLYPNGMTNAAATTAANNYLAANPYIAGASFDKQMEQIHTQFWASNFMNNVETYANWRRTGYPKLTPAKYAINETGGEIPRRLRYPITEQSLNTANYNAALVLQGADTFLTRVWWDKP